jgi:hypothetical protein
MHFRTLTTTLTIAAIAALTCEAAGADTPATSEPTNAQFVIRVERAEFHWGDAAIGAATGCGVALVITGGIAVRRSTSPPRPRTETNEQGETK